MIFYYYSFSRLSQREGFRVPLHRPAETKGPGEARIGICGKGFPMQAISFERERKKKGGLFPWLFARLHLVHMVVDILEDIDPSGPEFIEKKPFPFGRQEFFQQDVARGQVGGNNNFPHLIDFRRQGLQLHRRSLLLRNGQWDGTGLLFRKGIKPLLI